MARNRLTGNKQRLVELSERERRAAVTGGAVDDSVPVEAWESRLKDEHAHRFDVPRIAEDSRRAIGDCRGFHNPGSREPVVPERLEPGEIRDQAAQTADFIDGLILRLDNLHPDLKALAGDKLWRAHRETEWDVVERVKPDLYRIRAALLAAREDIPAGKPGPKSTPWSRARDRVATALREHSQPPVSGRDAEALAVELLEACGLKNPRRR